MPEYLAPGVYIEEVPTGSKPIEGVSTSTAGMVGVTERGPLDVPVLVTSVGEFSRWFGGYLRPADYGEHRFLPHAIEGFFTNGGKRVYVVRVLDSGATKAASPLFGRGDATSVASTLVRPASEGTGSAAGPPPVLLLPVTGLGTNDWVRIGDGSTAEYRQAAMAPVPQTVMVPVHLPLSRSHAAGDPTDQFVRAVFPESFTLEEDAEKGSTSIIVRGTSADIANLVPGDAIELGDPVGAEYRFVLEVTRVTVVSPTDSTARLRLDSPLFLGYVVGPVAIPVLRVDLTGGTVNATTITIETATCGSGLFYVDDRLGDFDVRADLVRLSTGVGEELRRIGELSQFDIAPGAYDGYPDGTLVEEVLLRPDRTLSVAPAPGDTELVLQPGETDGLVVGQRIEIDPTGTREPVVVQGIDASTDTLTVAPALANAHSSGDAVVPVAKATTAAVSAGGRVLALDDRMGIVEGTVLRVGTGSTAELVTVTALPALSFVAPDPGNVVVAPGVSIAFPLATVVEIVGSVEPDSTRQPCALALPAAAGSVNLYVTDGDSFVTGDIIRVTTPGDDVQFHVLTQNASAVVPEMLTLQTSLQRAHSPGSPVVGRDPVIDVEALDAGIWGNRLRISVQDESPGLVSPTTLATIVNATTIRLASANGVQPGTVLELFDPATGDAVGDPVKVSNVDRLAGFTISLAGTGLAPAQQVVGLGVRSREFRITVRLLRQPDPSTPSRNDQEIDREDFRHLSLDPRHSNYVEKIIGEIGGPLRRWDRRPEGSSLYIRVQDRATSQGVEQSVRLGPETLIDVRPDGRREWARLRLEQVLGADSIGGLSEARYVGDDNVDPDLRTGLQCLRNVEDISIVAIPGQVGPQVQQGVVDHCELLRYRFAVLDTRPGPADTVSDAQNQRQQFDTKYAALYYPWLSIPDPFPDNLDDVRAYAIPPTGHVLGVYARTDIDRGVHKAPANEIVRGITGIERRVNKEQQDILNPYPVNVNVIRDFRHNNRGIRVYGGRVITSDPDWKYVNVRRLVIFLEASIERGLQWVVFEPNSEPLWALVRRVISNFLTVVWRNGALGGDQGRGGVLRQVRSHDHDPDGCRQRQVDRGGRGGAREAG